MGKPLGDASGAAEWALKPKKAGPLTTADKRVLRLLENVAVCLWGATSRFRHSEEAAHDGPHKRLNGGFDATSSDAPQCRKGLSSVLMARDNWYTVLWHMTHFQGVEDSDGEMVRTCGMGTLSSAVR